MSDQTPPPPEGFPPPPPPPPPPAPYGSAPPPPPPLPQYVPQPGSFEPPPTYNLGPVGKVRSTGTCILLTIVTLGIYPFFWVFLVHDELKRHNGQGIGGLVAFILWFFVGPVLPFFTSSEVGAAQRMTGRPQTVSGVTGLWFFPGIFILIGPIVWFVKTNGALNDYWKSMGAPA